MFALQPLDVSNTVLFDSSSTTRVNATSFSLLSPTQVVLPRLVPPRAKLPSTVPSLSLGGLGFLATPSPPPARFPFYAVNNKLFDTLAHLHNGSHGGGQWVLVA